MDPIHKKPKEGKVAMWVKTVVPVPMFYRIGSLQLSPRLSLPTFLIINTLFKNFSQMVFGSIATKQAEKETASIQFYHIPN